MLWTTFPSPYRRTFSDVVYVGGIIVVAFVYTRGEMENLFISSNPISEVDMRLKRHAELLRTAMI
jgi:hypothetical protein